MPHAPLSRRAFLAWSVAAAAAARGHATAPDSFRLLVHGRLSDSASRGLRFGVEEASVTASLMQRELELGTSAASLRGAIGVIAAEPPTAEAIPARTPVVLLRNVSGLSDASCTFRVRLTQAERQSALERWRSTSPDPSKFSEPQIVEWHASLARFGAGELNDRFRKQTGVGMDADSWLAWFAVKALVDSALRSPDAPRCDALARARFDGHKGRPLQFDPVTRVLRQPLYVMSGDTVVAELAGGGQV